MVTHTTVRERDAHADYAAAKGGDPHAAVRLAHGLLNPPAVERIGGLLGDRRPSVLAVSALEQTGFNAIPTALAAEVATVLGLRVATGIIQANVVSHTRADGWHRIAFRAEFEGPATAGEYLIIDDHIGLGGTIAELRAFLHDHGGTVVGASTLTASRGSEIIALAPSTLAKLKAKHGQGLETFWRETFGYGLDGLTDPEAGYLLRAASVDAIRDRLAETAGKSRPDGS